MTLRKLRLHNALPWLFILLTVGRPVAAVQGGHVLSESDPVFSSLVQVVAVKGSKVFVCSGAFTAPKLVVTAAHCFTDEKTGRNLKGFKFYVHRGNLAGPWLETIGQDPAVWAPVEKFRIHSAYTSLIHNNDIALVKVAFKESTHAVIPPLLTTAFMRPGTKVRIFGSGPSTVDDARTKTCTYRVLNGEITGRMIKEWGMVEVSLIGDPRADAEPPTGRVGLNFGDSGGPSLVKLDGVEYLWAVESQAEQFISLGHHREWILNNARALGIQL